MTIVEMAQQVLIEVHPQETIPVVAEAPQKGTSKQKPASKKPRPSRSEKKPAPVDTNQPALDVHAKDEVERIYSLLSPLVRKINGKLYADVPIEQDTKKSYELKVKSDRGDPLRNWAKEQYWGLFPGDKDPRVSSFDIACGRLYREYDISEEDTNKSRSRKVPESAHAELEAELMARADFLVSACDAGAMYLRIPYTEEAPALTGLWRTGGKAPCHLIDCYIRFSDLNRPHSRSKSTEYSGTLHTIDNKGVTRVMEVDREAIEKEGLDAKLKGFAVVVRQRARRDWLMEAIDNLMREDGVTIRDQSESLGWVGHKQYGLTWLYNNGIETASGFIPADKAPFVAPNIVSPGNGYRGIPDMPEPNDDIWDLWLNRLNPSNWERVYGKLGAHARVKFPEGTVENAGTLDFAINTVGDGSGQGKSAEDNYILSLDGVDFRYDFPAYLSETDTQPGRLRPMSKVRYCLFGDYDRKARPSQNNFEKQHESLKLMISQYADHTGGGTISSRDAQKERARGKPCGGALLTGNYDHAPTSIEREEEAIEYRVCTFLVNPGECAKRDVSQQIDARRIELFSWGVAFKRWIASQHNKDAHSFTLHIQGLRAKAESLVSDAGHDWPHHRFLNQCVDLVWGVCAWKSFLEECYPESFLFQWLDTLTPAFIDARYQRACYVQNLVDKRKGGTTPVQFALEAIRYLLGSSQCYIASQQNLSLKPDEIPMSPSDFGMVRKVFDEKEEWVPGRTLVGYYLPRKGSIAFIPDMFYQEVAKEAARRKFLMPNFQDFKKQLAEADITKVKRTEEGDIIEFDTNEWINGKSKRRLTIPLQTLYPEPALGEGDTDEEEEYQVAADEAKVTPIKKRSNPIEERPDDEIVANDLF